MEPKLQALLDKIYQEGVAKGEEVAAAVVRDAERKAETIVQEAEREATELRARARKEAEDLQRNVTSELRLAAEQSVSALKQQILHLLTFKTVGEPLKKTFSDQDFLRGTIEQVIRHWQESPDRDEELVLLLPPEKGEELYQYFTAKSKDLLDGGLQVDFDGRLTNGFRVGPANGNYVLSFTDQDFEAFFLDYLRPRTRELLFKEE